MHVLVNNTLQHFIGQAKAVLAFKLTAGDGKKQPPFLVKAEELKRKLWIFRKEMGFC